MTIHWSHWSKDVLGRPCRMDVGVTFSRVVAPLREYCKAMHYWSDAQSQSKSPMPLHIGLICDENDIKDSGIDSHLWFTIKRPIITQIGMTVAVGKDEGGQQAMAAGELICF